MSSGLWQGNIVLLREIASGGVREVATARHGTTITSEKYSMKPACRNLNIRQSFVQRWDITLSMFIVPTCNSTTITSEKHSVVPASSHLGIWHCFNQRWNGALSITVQAAGRSMAITPEKNGVIATCGDLGVWHALFQRWNVSLSAIISSECNNIAITSKQHDMRPTGRHLDEGLSHTQRLKVPWSKAEAAQKSQAIASEKQCMPFTSWNLNVSQPFREREATLFIIVSSASNSNTITSEQHGMGPAGWHLGVWHCFNQGWKIALPPIISSASDGPAVALQQHGMKLSSRNHSPGKGKKAMRICRLNQENAGAGCDPLVPRCSNLWLAMCNLWNGTPSRS